MNYIIMLTAGIFGIAFHALLRIREMNKMLPKETFGSVLKAYMQIDFLCIIGSLLTVGFVIFLLAGQLPTPDQPDKTGDAEDWMLYYLLKYIRLAFAFLGYVGDSIIYSLFGKIGKKLAEKGLDINDAKSTV